MEYHISTNGGKRWKVYKTKRGLMNYMKKQTGMCITNIKRSTKSGNWFIIMRSKYFRVPSTPGHQSASWVIDGWFIYQDRADCKW